MNISFIGGGNMAEAIVAAVLRAGSCAAADLLVCEPREERRAALRAAYGIAVSGDNAAALARGGTVVLAVKPQQLEAVAAEVAGLMTAEHLVLSIAAGKRLAWLEGLFPRSPVVRVMPNVAAFVGAGMNVFTCGVRVTAAHRARVEALLRTFGEILELPDAAFDAVTALSGSGPAFLAYLLQGLAAGGEALGLPAAAAGMLARQTMLGTARLMAEREMTPEALIAAVSSPNGTTVAGLGVLRASDVTEVLAATLRAAAERSAALSA